MESFPLPPPILELLPCLGLILILILIPILILILILACRSSNGSPEHAAMVPGPGPVPPGGQAPGSHNPELWEDWPATAGPLRCLICEEDHETRNCPRPDCWACGQTPHHWAAECTNSTCELCAGAHVTDYCHLYRQCDNCGRSGHIAADCGDPAACTVCGTAGHTNADCWVPKCRRCDAADHMESSCPQARPCEICNQLHSAGNCSLPKCFNCCVVGHSSWDCSPEETVCFQCGAKGHYKKDCMETETKFCGICYSCGEQGHIQRDCPRNQPVPAGGSLGEPAALSSSLNAVPAFNSRPASPGPEPCPFERRLRRRGA